MSTIHEAAAAIAAAREEQREACVRNTATAHPVSSHIWREDVFSAIRATPLDSTPLGDLVNRLRGDISTLGADLLQARAELAASEALVDALQDERTKAVEAQVRLDRELRGANSLNPGAAGDAFMWEAKAQDLRYEVERLKIERDVREKSHQDELRNESRRAEQAEKDNAALREGARAVVEAFDGDAEVGLDANETRALDDLRALLSSEHPGSEYRSPEEVRELCLKVALLGLSGEHTSGPSNRETAGYIVDSILSESKETP